MLEIARNDKVIGGGLEAEVTVYANDEYRTLLEQLGDELRFVLISPEGCAAILWKSADKASEAAEIMGITASRLKALGLIDEIIDEPVGGAHRDMNAMVVKLRPAIAEALRQLFGIRCADLVRQRQSRIAAYGKFKEVTA